MKPDSGPVEESDPCRWYADTLTKTTFSGTLHREIFPKQNMVCFRSHNERATPECTADSGEEGLNLHAATHGTSSSVWRNKQRRCSLELMA